MPRKPTKREASEARERFEILQMRAITRAQIIKAHQLPIVESTLVGHLNRLGISPKSYEANEGRAGRKTPLYTLAQAAKVAKHIAAMRKE